MRKEAHIYFDDELYQQIKDYSVSKKKSINEAINNLIKLGLDANANRELASELKVQMNDTNKKANLTFLLLKQLYSELAFPKTSETSNRK